MDIAKEARDYFEQAKRDNGDSYWRIMRGAPEWIQDMAREAHGDMLPDDYRYEYIVDALDMLSDYEGTEPSEAAQIESDIYTSDLAQWLASHSDRCWYCDEAVTEYGLAQSTPIVERMQSGQLMERSEVFDSVLSSLQAQADS